MNARLVKLAFALCSLSLLNLAASLQAQDTNSADVPPPPGYANGGVPQAPGYRGGPMGNAEVLPMFDIQIEDGKLSLAPLKDKTEIKKIWGTDASSVPATIDNITKYLRAVDPKLNVILSPEVGSITIYNLKLNTRLLGTISDAISVASGGAIRGNGAGRGGGGGEFFGGGARGERGLTFAASNSESHPAIEVFNLSGYIQSLGKMDENDVRRKLDEVQNLITQTLKDLRVTKSSADLPNFKYHSGTKLLIVTGKPEAIDVTRKIVNALSGQQRNFKEDLLMPLDTPPASDQK